MRIRIVEPHDNPLLLSTIIMESVARPEPRLASKVWRLFSNYIEFKYLSINDERRMEARNLVEYVIAEIEGSIIPKLIKILSDPSSSDEYVEAGILMYFVLKNENLLGKTQSRIFVQKLLHRVIMCINDYNMLVGVSSPALSRCLGLSFAIYDELSNEHKDMLMNIFNSLCSNKDSIMKNLCFCTYALFGKSLNALTKNGIREVTEIFDVVKMIDLDKATPELITVLFLINGIITLVIKDHRLLKEAEDLSFKMLDVISKTLISRERVVRTKSFRRQFWTILILAIKVNRFDRITYVSRNDVVLSRRDLEQFRELLSSAVSRSRLWFEIGGILVSAIASYLVNALNTVKYEYALPIILIIMTYALYDLVKNLRKCLRYLDQMKSWLDEVLKY